MNRGPVRDAHRAFFLPAGFPPAEAPRDLQKRIPGVSAPSDIS
jgi:hypothetical protein